MLHQKIKKNRTCFSTNPIHILTKTKLTTKKTNIFLYKQSVFNCKGSTFICNHQIILAFFS